MLAQPQRLLLSAAVFAVSVPSLRISHRAMSSDDEEAELAQLRAQRSERTGVPDAVGSCVGLRKAFNTQHCIRKWSCSQRSAYMQKALRQQNQKREMPSASFFEGADQRSNIAKSACSWSHVMCFPGLLQAAACMAAELFQCVTMQFTVLSWQLSC